MVVRTKNILITDDIKFRDEHQYKDEHSTKWSRNVSGKNQSSIFIRRLNKWRFLKPTPSSPQLPEREKTVKRWSSWTCQKAMHLQMFLLGPFMHLSMIENRYYMCLKRSTNKYCQRNSESHIGTSESSYGSNTTGFFCHWPWIKHGRILRGGAPNQIAGDDQSTTKNANAQNRLGKVDMVAWSSAVIKQKI